MNRFDTLRSLLSAATLLIGGCGTPQVALDQANNTVGLIQNLQGELAKYRDNSQRSAERRLASAERSDIGTLSIAFEQKWGDYIYQASGQTTEVTARVRLRNASDEYGKIISERDKAQDELAVRRLTITTPPPSPDTKLTAVQKAMAELGSELSMSERIAIVRKFLQQAKCIVDQSTATPDDAASTPATVASGAIATPAKAAPAASGASTPTSTNCTSATKENA